MARQAGQKKMSKHLLLPRFGSLLLFSFFFFNIEYLFYSFVLRGRRIEGLAGAKPCPLFRFLFSSPI